MHTDMSSSYRFAGFVVCFCAFTGASLFVLALVILCFVYFLLVIVWFVSISAIDCHLTPPTIFNF